ncbi:MAG: DUF4168 domain-containing protein [Hyphomonadaceae bacterium]|nr:DUF4168 domain-containing protein [Hyphomonadaceae bacterium]
MASRILAPSGAAILLALAIAGCASNRTESADAPAAPAMVAAPDEPDLATPQATNPGVSPTSPTPTPGAFSDSQVQSFARASVEVDQVQSRHQAGLAAGTPEQQAAARQAMGAELSAVLQRNGIDPDTYNTIARAARTDPALAQRITTLRAQAGAPG